MSTDKQEHKYELSPVAAWSFGMAAVLVGLLLGGFLFGSTPDVTMEYPDADVGPATVIEVPPARIGGDVVPSGLRCEEDEVIALTPEGVVCIHVEVEHLEG